MTIKRRDPREEPDDAAGEQARTTLRPPFDPSAFARESERMLAAAPALAPDLSAVGDDAGSMPEVIEGDPGTVAIDALGPDSVPFVVMAPEDVAWFDVPPDVARLLACIDGTSSLGAVCATANISADDGASMLLDLAEWGVVSFR